MTTTQPQSAQRLDQWLYRARFFKTRAAAGRFCAAGKVRVDGERVRRASRLVRAGDVLTFVRARRVIVLRVAALPARRGPALEAREAYELIEPAQAEVDGRELSHDI